MKMHSFRKFLLYSTLIVSTGLLFVSCQKDITSFPDDIPSFPDPSTLPQGLGGSWVEIHTLADTLMFNSDRDTGLVFLQRGYEIRNGYYLPIIGSDGYKYMILNDSIRLMGGLSALPFDEIFYFKCDEKNLMIHIGKFSEYIESDKSILIFRKIK
jgi:hypothetical protein